MQQVLFRIPIKFGFAPNGIPVFGFGMMLFIAFLLCTWLAARRAQREGVSPQLIQDLAIWIFLGGLLGARITYIFGEAKPNTVGDFFYLLPRIWDGGIVLYGAVLGGIAAYALAYLLFLRKSGHTTWQLIDILAPAIAIGIALGRFGCFLNGCCYGQVVCEQCIAYPVHFPLSAPPRYDLSASGYQTAGGFTFDPEQPPQGAQVGKVEPGSSAESAGLKSGDIITAANGMKIPQAAALSEYLGSYDLMPRGQNELALSVNNHQLNLWPRTLGLHPTQLYETISMLLLFLVLTAFYPLRTRRGQVTALLMMGYAVHRYLNEMLRGDPRPVEFEWIGSVILFGGGALLMIWLQSRAAEFRLAEPTKI